MKSFRPKISVYTGRKAVEQIRMNNNSAGWNAYLPVSNTSAPCRQTVACTSIIVLVPHLIKVTGEFQPWSVSFSLLENYDQTEEEMI